MAMAQRTMAQRDRMTTMTMAAVRRGMKLTIMAKAQQATTTTMTTMMGMGMAQRDATIKSRQRGQRVATLVIGVQRRIATTARAMTTAHARIARRECGRSVGGRRRSPRHQCGGVCRWG